MLTPDDMREKLRAACAQAGSQKAWADANDVSAQYVCDALQGRREIGKSIAVALGYEPRTYYVKQRK